MYLAPKNIDIFVRHIQSKERALKNFGTKEYKKLERNIFDVHVKRLKRDVMINKSYH